MSPRAAACAVVAATALLAGCGSDGRPSDAERLESYTALVQAQLYTYEAGAAAGYPEAQAALSTQRRRVQELRALVEEAGRTPPVPAQSVAEVDRVLPGLGEVRSRSDFARFVSEIESVVKAAQAELSPAIP